MLEALSAALDGSGPAILPLDPALPRARLAALLDAFAPAAIETAAGTKRLASGAARRPARPGVRPEIAVVIATSGSTGLPKGVELPAAALLASARASLDRIGARDGERWLCCLPHFHVAGIAVLVRSLLAGTAPLVSERLDAEVLAGAVAGGSCAYASLVPTQLRRLLDAGAPLPALRAILLGGAAPPAGLLDQARSAGARVITTYGMSETCGGCVYDGLPLDRVSADIGDDRRIRIAGPVLFGGYRLRPDLTAAALDGGRFVTSDLGSLDAAGRLVIIGRADDVINTGGEKVVAAQVEAILAGCDGVRDAVVIGVPDPEWGERVTALVVPADPAAPPGLDVLRAQVRGVLPSYAAPRGLMFLPEIPLLPSGKPDREALRRLGIEGVRGTGPRGGPGAGARAQPGGGAGARQAGARHPDGNNRPS
jgi:O-succinylbenzoic acid--CoA ligase